MSEKVNIEFTAQEKKVLILTVALVKAFEALPKEHPMERAEFVSAIHRIQDLVIARPGSRILNSVEDNDWWPSLEGVIGVKVKEQGKK